MRKKPKISIIIPVYNVEKYLRQCLDSVVNQTLRDIEIICVDDCSTDSSRQILQEYAAKDKRITVITQQNAGPAVSRNRGLEQTNAPYLMFIDSDDYIAPDMAQSLYDMMIEHNPDIVICDVECVAQDNAPEKITARTTRMQSWFAKYVMPPGKHPIPANIRGKISSVVWNKLYKTEIIQKYGVRFPDDLFQEDEFWLWAYMIHCNDLYFINRKLYFYRMRENSIMDTKNNSPKILDVLDIQKLIYAEVRKYSDIMKYKHFLTEQYLSLVKQLSEIMPNTLYSAYISKIRDYVFNCNPSIKLLEYYRQIQNKLNKETAQQSAPAQVETKPQKQPVVKQKNTLKLFNILPIWSCKKRGGKYVYYLFGIPFWKVRRIEDSRICKYYLFDIPLCRTENRILTETDILGAELHKTNRKLMQALDRQNEMKQQLWMVCEDKEVLQKIIAELTESCAKEQ